MKFFTKEVKIAIVAIIGIIVIFCGMNFLKGEAMLSSDNTFFITFEDVTGLAESNPIYANGYKVGVVKKITYDFENNKGILVEIDVEKQIHIPTGSTAEVVGDLLGNVRVNLIMNHETTTFLKPNDIIKGNINSGAMGEAANMVPAVQKMLPKLDSILTSLNGLLADPALANSLHNVQGITENLTVTTTQLNTMMYSLNKNVPQMMVKANGILDNTGTLTSNLATLDVASTLAKVDKTLANVQSFTDKLNSNQGSLGLLMNDPSLYNNLNSTMQHSDSLMIDLKANPKRYVHFSVFGGK